MATRQMTGTLLSLNKLRSR